MRTRKLNPAGATQEQPSQTPAPTAAPKRPDGPPLPLRDFKNVSRAPAVKVEASATGTDAPDETVHITDTSSAQEVVSQQSQESGLSQPLTAGAPAQNDSPSDRSYLQLDARLIDQNAHPPRLTYIDDAIKEIADSISKNGQRDAIHVIPHPKKPGRYIIGDGWTRVLAIRSYGINNGTVLAAVHKNLTESEASWLGMLQNDERSQLTDFDRGMYFANWLDDGMTIDDIANRVKMSRTRVGEFVVIRNLPMEIKEHARRTPKKMSASVFAIISSILNKSSEDKAIAICNKYIAGDHTHAWLRKQASEISENSRKKSANSVQYQRRYGQGHYRQRASGQVELNVVIPDTSLVTQFNADLEELLKKYLPQETADANGTAEGPDSDSESTGSTSE